MDSILVSVIMPVYNSERFLEESISSILKQTHSDFEFIIINDGSTDNSLKIIKKFLKIDNRIILINKKNSGIVESLNEGIKISRGKYIARMDSDDYSLPKRIEQQINLMEELNLDLCGGHYFLIDENGLLNGLNLTPRTNELCLLSFSSKVAFAHPTVMIRKNFLDTNNLKYGQGEFKNAEDLDLWIRIINSGGKLGNVDDVILKYRILKDSLSRSNDRNILRESVVLFNNYRNQNKKRLIELLHLNFKNLNNEEESIVIRNVFRMYFLKLKFNKYHLIRKLRKKNIFYTLTSEFSQLLKIKL
jgi:glycosyltransferase involved in cell wall biosynthesis